MVFEYLILEDKQSNSPGFSERIEGDTNNGRSVLARGRMSHTEKRGLSQPIKEVVIEKGCDY